MKTSRLEGILVMETKKPYKMAIDGNMEPRNEIILNDVNEACENAAYDLEQLLMAASVSIPQTNIKVDQKRSEAEDKETQNFFSDDCPSEKAINNMALSLESMVSLSTGVKMSEIMEVFNDFVSAGVVKCAGGAKMEPNIWRTVDRKDKKRIVFRYASFFANPLESLQNME